jgi:hypothetical protein
MSLARSALAGALAFLLSGAVAFAQPRPQAADPDWPCAQRRVPSIAIGTVWSGPDPAEVGPWGSDFEAAALAQRLASRRTPLDEVGPLLDAFAKNAGPEKAARLTRVFAGVHELINTERDRVMAGISRYAQGQRRVAERVRAEADRISAAKDSPDAPTTPEIAEVERQFTWDRRIFEDRSQALAYVCEAPVMLEQRLFEIAQRIQAKL